MNKKLRFLILLLSCFIYQTKSYASHQMASELTYVALAQNTYLVTLNFYRDCSGALAALNYPLRITSQGCNTGRQINMTRVGSGAGIYGTPYCSSTLNNCSNASTNPSANYEKFTFTATVSFSAAEANCQNWILSVLFQDGVRPATANVPSQPEMYIETFLKLNSINNSAVFTSMSPSVPIINQNKQITFSNLAYDPDGDSLSYSLVPALSAANTPVLYAANYSYSNPMQSPSFTLDSNTGTVSFVAPAFSTAGIDKNKYTTALKVDEWRKISGIITKVGSTMRDMLILIKDNNTNSNPTFSSVANNQLINNNDLIRVRPGSTLSLQLTGTDANAGDIVQLTTDATSILPGATFTPSATGNHAGTIVWTIPASTTLDKPYYFTVKVNDNACPLLGFETRAMGIVVSSSGTPTGTSKPRKEATSFIAYPNPFQEGVTFKLNLQPSGNQTLIIYNALGKQVDQISLKGKGTGEQQIVWKNGAKMATGQYTAKLVDESQVSQTIKFSKL